MIGIDVLGLWDRLSKLGFAGLLFFILVGFQQGWWFFSRERDEWKRALEAMTKDRDEWKTRALMAMQAGERTVAVAQTALPAPQAGTS